MATKILIVEDNPDSRGYLAALLSIKGYTVFTAADGVEGIESARAKLPDLIISDLTMPNLDGLEMMRRLREIPECRNIPIFAVSAFGSGKLSEATKVGADFLLRKPLDCNLLLETIARFVVGARRNKVSGKAPLIRR